jgi:hypothetical protein
MSLKSFIIASVYGCVVLSALAGELGGPELVDVDSSGSEHDDISAKSMESMIYDLLFSFQILSRHRKTPPIAL